MFILFGAALFSLSVFASFDSYLQAQKIVTARLPLKKEDLYGAHSKVGQWKQAVSTLLLLFALPSWLSRFVSRSVFSAEKQYVVPGWPWQLYVFGIVLLVTAGKKVLGEVGVPFRDQWTTADTALLSWGIGTHIIQEALLAGE